MSAHSCEKGGRGRKGVVNHLPDWTGLWWWWRWRWGCGGAWAALCRSQTVTASTSEFKWDKWVAGIWRQLRLPDGEKHATAASIEWHLAGSPSPWGAGDRPKVVEGRRFRNSGCCFRLHSGLKRVEAVNGVCFFSTPAYFCTQGFGRRGLVRWVPPFARRQHVTPVDNLDLLHGSVNLLYCKWRENIKTLHGKASTSGLRTCDSLAKMLTC